jgi:hypothetical protein
MLSIRKDSQVFQPRCGVMTRGLDIVVAMMILYLCAYYPFDCSARPLEESVEIGKSVVRYGEFGAHGDGVTDDIDAIAKAMNSRISTASL